MNGFVIIAIVGVVVLALVFWTIFKRVKSDKSNRKFLTQSGFVDCPEEEAFLQQTVTFLEQNGEYTYGIDHPMKASIEGRTAYFYAKNRHRQGEDPYAAHEFLIALNGKVKEPFVLYCKPSSVGDGMGVQLLKKITTTNWDAQPDDLQKVQVPKEYSNILGVLGPEGSSFSTLIDSSILSLLTQAGDYGVLAFRCREDKCSFDNPGSYLTWDYSKILSFIQQLIRQV